MGGDPVAVQDGSEYVAEVLRCVAHPVRIRILRIIGTERKYVYELSAELGIEQPNISQHLAAMRRAGVLKVEREGTRAVYSACCQDVFRMLEAAEAITNHCTRARVEVMLDPTGTRLDEGH